MDLNYINNEIKELKVRLHDLENLKIEKEKYNSKKHKESDGAKPIKRLNN